MKKTILSILLIGMINLSCYAPDYRSLVILRHQNILMPDRILLAHIQFESKNDRYAYNETEDAVGILQIRPIMILEANRILALQGSKIRYSLEDRLSVDKSIEIWYIVQNYWNPQYNLAKASRLWNGGSPHYSESTKEYVAQIKAIYYDDEKI